MTYSNLQQDRQVKSHQNRDLSLFYFFFGVYTDTNLDGPAVEGHESMLLVDLGKRSAAPKLVELPAPPVTWLLFGGQFHDEKRETDGFGVPDLMKLAYELKLIIRHYIP